MHSEKSTQADSLLQRTECFQPSLVLLSYLLIASAKKAVCMLKLKLDKWVLNERMCTPDSGLIHLFHGRWQPVV